MPGGHSLGVKLRPDGVIVVGFASITDDKGDKTSTGSRSRHTGWRYNSVR
ncbi:MAG: hypothetical protein ACOX2A_10470 [Tepidanaerobacteraceae bacterium]